MSLEQIFREGRRRRTRRRRRRRKRRSRRRRRRRRRRKRIYLGQIWFLLITSICLSLRQYSTL